MSICKIGLDYKFLITQTVMIEVSPKHPLILLKNAIDWQALTELILPDLKTSTSKMNEWLGRKLKVYSHFDMFLLQQLLNETDRGIVRQTRDNAVYAIFCGKGAMQK